MILERFFPLFRWTVRLHETRILLLGVKIWLLGVKILLLELPDYTTKKEGPGFRRKLKGNELWKFLLGTKIVRKCFPLKNTWSDLKKNNPEQLQTTFRNFSALEEGI